jgi:hypothetical protein
MKTIRGSLILLAAAALLAVAAFSTSAGAAGYAVKYPPCTKKALNAGLTRGTAQEPQGRVLARFACVRGWAYADIAVGHGKNGFDAIALYKAKNGKWVTVKRAGPCNKKGVLPKKIFNGACTAD